MDGQLNRGGYTKIELSRIGDRGSWCRRLFSSRRGIGGFLRPQGRGKSQDLSQQQKDGRACVIRLNSIAHLSAKSKLLAYMFVRDVAASGEDILFVGTKKQAGDAGSPRGRCPRVKAAGFDPASLLAQEREHAFSYGINPFCAERHTGSGKCNDAGLSVKPRFGAEGCTALVYHRLSFLRAEKGWGQVCTDFLITATQIV